MAPEAAHPAGRVRALVHLAAWWAALGVCAVPVLWAAVVLTSQVQWWFKTGDWQPVPLGALLVQSEPDFSYIWAPGSAPHAPTPHRRRPVDLVPTVADYPDLASAADRIAGGRRGGAQVVRWLLERSLVGWVFCIEFIAYAVMMAWIDRRRS
ncbi:MAG: hypothetical protein M3N82_02730 [Pseudomonadota bacterium]|nr:hypothetical protein [Pseudomonadota bacterium]